MTRPASAYETPRANRIVESLSFCSRSRLQESVQRMRFRNITRCWRRKAPSPCPLTERTSRAPPLSVSSIASRLHRKMPPLRGPRTPIARMVCFQLRAPIGGPKQNKLVGPKARFLFVPEIQAPHHALPQNWKERRALACHTSVAPTVTANIKESREATLLGHGAQLRLEVGECPLEMPWRHGGRPGPDRPPPVTVATNVCTGHCGWRPRGRCCMHQSAAAGRAK